MKVGDIVRRKKEYRNKNKWDYGTTPKQRGELFKVVRASGGSIYLNRDRLPNFRWRPSYFDLVQEE